MSGRERRPVTIYEVAERAGVSIATVSRALRDSDLVAPATRRRVQQVAEELRFRPSRAGRALAEGQHAANGIVFPDLSGPYYAEVVLGYEEVVAELGRSVLILATNGRAKAEEAVLELAGRVDGMVIMGRTVGDHVVARIADTGLPLVLLARPPVGLVDTVTADNESSARDLTAHLLGHGHRRIAFLGDPAESPDVAGRYTGFRRALTDGGFTVPAATPCAFDVRSGYAAAKDLLRTRPDAVVCANDEVALGALRAAEDLGLDVPGDVALTGWDDIMAAGYARLTTVHQSMRELGATAARWLDERIGGSTTDRQTLARREVLPTRLVIRASCGPHSDG
ncbi:LacI family DNA-binding transcriptional regulator [Actinophytocola sp. NPDC049390]|uniref:LacI family DNA-binding transcriptional regulator n=1 Tax=Actinophytocola sp. NPDC049390 TaxID=3363894 RepID=UPI00378DC03F